VQIITVEKGLHVCILCVCYVSVTSLKFFYTEWCTSVKWGNPIYVGVWSRSIQNLPEIKRDTWIIQEWLYDFVIERTPVVELISKGCRPTYIRIFQIGSSPEIQSHWICICWWRGLRDRNSVRLSVCHTRALSRNERIHCRYFDTYKGNQSSFLKPTVIGGRCPFLPEIWLKMTHSLSKTPTSTNICL